MIDLLVLENLVSWKNAIIYIIIHLLTYWYAVEKTKKILTIDEKRDQKYAPFARTDKSYYTWRMFPRNSLLI